MILDDDDVGILETSDMDPLRDGKDTQGIPRGIVDRWQRSQRDTDAGPLRVGKGAKGIPTGVLFEGWQGSQGDPHGDPGGLARKPRGVLRGSLRDNKDPMGIGEGTLRDGTATKGIPRGVL